LTSGNDIWAVVPIKETTAAKQRLAGVVPPHLRQGLALAMLEDVLQGLMRTRGLAGIAVVTVDPAASALAYRCGAQVFTDDARGGHTAAVRAAAQRLAVEGRGGMLQLPGDIPLVSPDQISLLLATHRPAPSFTIAPSHDELGSNAVLVSSPTAVPLTFGDDSFDPHLRAARACGIMPSIVRLPGIGLDIDWPEDILAFARLKSRTRAQAFIDRHDLAGGAREPTGAVA
jgi:2-phospho-L-lactate guanylyltransferase